MGGTRRRSAAAVPALARSRKSRSRARHRSGVGEGKERAGKGANAREALRGVAIERAEDDAVEAAGMRGLSWLGGRAKSVRIRSRSAYTPSAVKGAVAGDAFVEDRRERVLVARRRAVLHAEGLLGRHVKDGPSDELGAP